MASAVDFLRGKAQGWKIAADLVETSTAHAREVIGYILEKRSHHPEGALRASYDGVEIRVEIIYRGAQTSHLPALRRIGLRSILNWTMRRRPPTSDYATLSAASRSIVNE